MRASEIKSKEVLDLMRKHGSLITPKEMATILVRRHPPVHPSGYQQLVNEFEPEVLRKFNVFLGAKWVRLEYVEEGPYDILMPAFEITNRGIQAIAEI